MNRIAVIATHHKAGTVWMNDTFRKIGEALNIRVVNAGREPDLALTPPVILCAANAQLRTYDYVGDLAHFFHVVRDPRDVVISSMHYHCRADEKWLLRADPRLDGRTYKESICALATARERYTFEMHHSSARNVAGMLDWKFERSFECRYEDLIRDAGGAVFSHGCEHLGFSGADLDVCRDVFWRQAIFGGKAARRQQKLIPHVRSGEPEQWRGVFDRKLGEAFLAQFSAALIGLGYEKDNIWLDSLPACRPELDARTDALEASS